VRVEYELTEKGRELHNALREIGNWAERWIPLETNDGLETNSGNQAALDSTPQKHRARPRVQKVKRA
ncbi:MAG TPA: winged helix-turn-helix transcriptional regulator, partial [Gemmatimonadaceae bacterium]|nr:winged helix-turn-helix transcriptional regulator [Gemmatimonadaceae bacterium]